MSTSQEQNGAAAKPPQARKVDLKLEAVVIPVSDVDRAKSFYGSLGWRLDADFVVGDSFRVVQFTPPGSPASIHFGKGLTSAAPGAAQGLYLVVADIEAARAELVERGTNVSFVKSTSWRRTENPPQYSRHHALHFGASGRRSVMLDISPGCANSMVEIGHFPWWPPIEIRRPCISSSQTLSTVPAFPSVRITALPTSSAWA
jgi:predicted enzyme related to lactoylglutathione lyase